MKTNKDYILRTIAGESLLIPTGKAAQNMNGMINMTPTAAFIWQQVDKAGSVQEIIDSLRKEFDVDEATATQDVKGFLSELCRLGFVEDIPELEK